MTHTSARGNIDFRRLWLGATISQLGSAVSSVALPIVALTVVGASAFEVSVLAAVGAITTGLLALSVGVGVEYRRKRPVMIRADVIRFAIILTVPVAAAFHHVTFIQLCVVAAVNAACQVAYNAAATSHLKALVSADAIIDANGRLQSTLWLNLTLGPFVGGSLIRILTAPFTLVIDAVSFLANALVVSRIRTTEPPAPVRDRLVSKRAEIAGGFRFVWGHRTLRMLLLSWVVFAGASFMTGPLGTVFYIRVLHFNAVQFGLLMGVPSAFGFLGARFTSRFAARIGPVRLLWWASLLRSPWFFLTPIARPGTLGLVICLVSYSGLLFFAAMANSAMAGYRQLSTPDRYMARVTTLWAFATVAAQPLFAIAGGVLASHAGIREALFTAAAFMAASVLLLPRNEVRPDGESAIGADGRR